MKDRRKRGDLVTPDYEDRGLFRTGLVEIAVDLVPQTARNNRSDLLVLGLLESKHRVLVVFAGRRAKEARLLQTRLSHELARTRAAHGPRADPDLAAIRVQIKGAWRRRFVVDTDGWQVSEYHLLAAEWCWTDAQGTEFRGGEPPFTLA